MVTLLCSTLELALYVASSTQTMVHIKWKYKTIIRFHVSDCYWHFSPLIST